jgi:hypothetical protein
MAMDEKPILPTSSHSHMSNNLENLPLDHDLYAKITKISYSEHIPVPKLINDMLREHLNVYLLWRKIGYVLVSKDAVKAALNHTPDEELHEAAQKIANRYKEAAILLHGRATLDGYLELIKAFAAVNGYSFEKSKNGDNDVFIVQFNMNEKYSLFLGNAYKRLFEEVAQVQRFELTNNIIFLEYKPK